MADGWQPKTITIRVEYADGEMVDTMTVDAMVRPPFAVHRRVEGDGHYGITHLPTGLGIGNATGSFFSVEDAMRGADIARPLCAAWEIAKPDGGKDMRALQMRIAQALDAAGIRRARSGGKRWRHGETEPLNGYPPATPPAA